MLANKAAVDQDLKNSTHVKGVYSVIVGYSRLMDFLQPETPRYGGKRVTFVGRQTPYEQELKLSRPRFSRL